MSFTSEFNALQKKRKKTGDSFTDAFLELQDEETAAALSTASSAPTRTTTSKKKDEDEEEKKRTWFQSGAFEDGYQFGDITKTIIGTTQDTKENFGAGLLGIGEKLVDAFAILGQAEQNRMLNENMQSELAMSALTGKDANEIIDRYTEIQDTTKKSTTDFVAKDLYDEEKVAQKVNDLTIEAQIAKKILGVDRDIAAKEFNGSPVADSAVSSFEAYSVFGEKTDAVIQSAGQLAGTMALQAVGVPWYLTSGLTAFGGETESALNEGATYEEAALSGMISAGAEILTEKIGGISFGGETLTDLAVKKLASGISSKFLKIALTTGKIGLDAVGEGAEEWLTEDISTFGKWLTYQDDKTLSELLFSEEAMDAKIEAFLGGMVLGGGSNVVSTISKVSKGVDPITDLTKSEQAVFDKVYKDAIAKEEKDGKKLTSKEKAKLYNEVLEDIDKGRISTDIIEEVLGGEEYKTYKNTVAEENAILKEFEELGNKEHFTLKDSQRYAVLEERVKNITDNSPRYDMQNKLSDKMTGLMKDSKLAESYRDRDRRRQKFTADVSQYEGEYAKKTVQNAIDSGFMNNGVDAHDFVDFAAKLAEDRGYEVVFADSKSIEAMKAEYDLKADANRIEGFNSGKTKKVIVNMDANKSWASIVGHEFTDTIREAGHFEALRDAAKAYAEAKGDYQAKLDSVKSRYKGIDADIEGEVTSDIVGEYLNSDYDFVKHLHTNNRNVFQKIYDEIKYLYKLATAGSKEARQLEKMKHNFEKAIRESKGVESKTGTNYSLATVEEVQPKSDKWRRTLTTEEAKARFPKLWDVTADDSEVRNPTQISSTVNSYRKVYNYLQGEGFNGTILDASSGLGYGTRAGIEEYGFDVEDIEPYPDKSYNPKYRDYSALDKRYDVVISNAVLNVLPQDQRDALVIKMGEMLNDGGRIFINVRGKDVDTLASNKSNTNISPMEWFVDSTGSYQKGFTKPELVAYLQDALGDGFTVKPTNMFGAVSAIVTKDGGSDVNYSLSSMANTFFGDENMSANDFMRMDYKQTQGYKDYVNQSVNNMRQTRTDFDEVTARRDAKDAIDGIVRVAVAAKNAGYDIQDSGDRRNARDSKNRLLFSSLEPNSDYFTSNDISTECDKRKNFADIYDAIVKREEALGVPQGKRFFDNVDNYFYLHKVLADKGLTQPCRECYVESMRKNLAPMANAFLKLVGETNPNNTANDQLYQQKGKNKGELKSNNAKTREWVLERLSEYGMTASDLTIETLTTEDGLAQLKIQAPMIYEAFNSFYGQSKPKMPRKATPFRFGELTALLTDHNGKIKEGLVDKINSTGGFRLQSYSDFQVENYTDTLQVLFEAGTLGLRGHAYTKVPAFLDATEGTNLKRNISIFMYKDGGEWKLDRNHSFPYSLEEIYDIVKADKTGNTGIIAVSQNADMSAWIMANDLVGYGIPFHKSGMKMGTVRDTDVKTEDGRIVKGYSETKDHTKQQTEVWAKTTDDHKALTKVKKGINIYGDEVKWDFDNKDGLSKNELIEKNVTAYIDACERAGYLPKFREYVMNNGKVLNSVLEYSKQLGYASPDATIEDISFEYKDQDGNVKYRVPYGYYKFLGDFGMFTPDGKASPHEVLSLKNYNFDKAVNFFSDSEALHRNEILQQFANGAEREYYRNSNLTAGELKDIVAQKRGEVVDSVVAPVRNSLATEPIVPTREGDANESMRYHAPVREDLTRATENATATENTTAKQNAVQGKFEGGMPVTEEEAGAVASENLNSLTDADMPPETEAPYYEGENAAPSDPFANRDIKEVGNRKVKAYMYENPEVKPFFQEEAEIMLGELQDTTKGEKWYNDDLYYATNGEEGWGGTQRQTSDAIAYLLDNCNYTYAQIQEGLEAIIEDNGKENNAVSKRIEFLLNERLSEGYTDFRTGMNIPANDGYRNLLNEKQITEYSKEAFDKLVNDPYADAYVPSAEDYAPVIEDAPIKERYEAIRPKRETSEPRMKRVDSKEAKSENKTAEVYDAEPETAKKKSRGWSKFKANFLDKGSVFEDLSLKTKNRELMGKWNYTLSSESRAQWMIGKGADGVKSLNDIRAEVEGSGNTKQFYEYLYHKHNADRMSLEERYEGIENKPVFGYDVTAESSQKAVNELERANPEFKAYAEDVYAYMNHLRGLMVDSGVISQETADLWAEMYPHYVPIRRLGDSGLNINVPLDTGRTGINAPIKRATGGNRDILPLFDTMALRTEQTFKAIAKNNFGVELKNTLGTTIESNATSLDEVIEGVEKHDDLLKKGENGKNPTFTVFEDGKKVTFEITEDMYDALKPKSEGLAYTNKIANKISNIHRGLLTEFNPAFMATNAIKDFQDVLINSQHPAKTYANMPTAIGEMLSNGKWYAEYMQNGGEQNTYFDGETNSFTKDKSGLSKVIGMPLDAISKANNFIERAPRLAEYIASRKNGASVEVAMLDAARVTTNFAAGGDVTKFLNRNGATFLNASVQGAMQQVRNVREAKANGLKGWAQLATKVAVGGFSVALLNHLLWDDDEEYEELSDYVKQNYYIVAKYGDGQFVRIPKGRALAVIQNAFEQTINAATGDDEVDLKSFLELVVSNLAPNNPVEDNILAPIIQVANNETWYGDDLVPTRLQDLPAAEQYDESTDAISKWLGEKLNVSPYKVNYLLNQYSGGVGDVFLPMMTPEAERGDNSFLGNMLAPIKDKFTTDNVMNNQNVSDFYDTVDELTTNAKSSKATDEDVLKYKYMNSINSELGELYAEKREIQNSDLSDEEKYLAVREIQEQIVSLTRDSLATYGEVNIDNGYATIGDQHYRWYEPSEDSDAEAGWQKITDKQLEKQNEVTKGLGISASEYWSDKDEYDFAYDYPEKYEFLNANGVTYDDYKNGSEEFKDAYTWASKNPEKFTLSKAVADDVVEYRRYTSEMYDIKADKDADGKSISGSRKEKILDYINGLDLDYGAKIILFKSEYNADDTYNMDIIDYLNSRDDISYKQMETILKELGFKVDSKGNITWD